MTPKQRWQAIFNRQPTDRIPTDYWATGEFDAKLRKALGNAEGDGLFTKLNIDRPRWVGPKCNLKHHPDDPQADIWGVRHTRIDYGTGTYAESVVHPLAQFDTVAQIDNFRWPSADDFDYTGIPGQLAEDDGTRFINGGSYEPFLLYCSMRGMEQAYEDLIANPDIAHAVLAHLFDYFYEHNRRTLAAGGGKIECFYLAEDLGGQSSPLFSLDIYRRFFRDNQQKMAALAHSHGAKVFYHTDGSARIFLPDLIEIVGIDMLNPLQWRCPGMELPELVRDFGKHIAFHGGIDNQQTLPFGTVADVRKEVRWVAGVMKNARWVCAPCHNIQAVSPAENVVAMYEEIGLVSQGK